VSDAVYGRLDATLKMLDELTDLYLAIHNQPEHDFPMYSREAFIERTTAQCSRDGFELVSLRLDDRLIGFSCGSRPANGGRTPSHLRLPCSTPPSSP
jgi:hypothetical protein